MTLLVPELVLDLHAYLREGNRARRLAVGEFDDVEAEIALDDAAGRIDAEWEGRLLDRKSVV